MKQGRTLVELAAELQRQVESRHDYVAPTAKLDYVPTTSNKGKEPTDVALRVGDVGEYALTNHAHGQVALHAQIPQRYYDRMRTHAPALLAENVNHWMHAEDCNRMIRTLDGKARAFLSDRYRALDNFDLANVVLPELLNKGATVVASELTETKLYIKASLEALRVEVPGSREVGDIVQAGIVISNSEVGRGALNIEPMLYRLICKNGMIAPTALKRHHVGSVLELEEEVRAILSNEAKHADDKALWLKVRDVVRSSWDKELFEAQVAKLGEATQQKIASTKLQAVVEVVTDKYRLPESMGGGILKNLIEGGDLSRYGLMNAVTAMANDDDVDFETGTELQRLGGKLIELSKDDWAEIAEAA